jgi:tRNA G18 (ribose-2'-O)-methylase SpoU
MASIKKTMAELERLSPIEYAKNYAENGLIIVCDNLRSAFNVGSIFRTGDAFGVSKVLLCGITCPINNRELQKTALGAECSIPSMYYQNTMDAIQELKQEKFKIIALEQTSEAISLSKFSFDRDQKYAIVIGNEVEGVTDSVLELCDLAIEIPQIGSKHSLNVSNASSILIWEFFKQMK